MKLREIIEKIDKSHKNSCYISLSELALIRNKEREEDKMIPVRAIEKMYRKLEMPTIAECHELIVIK